MVFFPLDGFLSFPFRAFPPHATNLPHLTLAKGELQVEQVCGQVGRGGAGTWKPCCWGVSRISEWGENVCFPPSGLCLLLIFLCPGFFWGVAVGVGGAKWISGRKVWFQADPSLATGTRMGLCCGHNTKWMLIVTRIETLANHLKKNC